MPMLFPTVSEDELYEALVRRDPSFEGRTYVGVPSTGIFCRFTCVGRKPKRKNCLFYHSIQECLAAGFRPCLRCRPLAPISQAHPVVGTLMEVLEAEPGRRWLEADIAARGLAPSTVRRIFKRHVGVTFLEFARRQRLTVGGAALAAHKPVIEAQLDAGFDSASGFRAAFTRVLGQPPAALSLQTALAANWFNSPLGPLLGVADKRAVHMLEFFDRRGLPEELRRLQQRASSAIGIGWTPVIEQIETELKAYFAGQWTDFRTPLALTGPAFTRQVWTALRTIPWGETRSYQAMAKAIGQPTAVPAVARANGANQIAIVIPCYRVIGMNGDLTGYGGGLLRKQWLLDHERRFARVQPASEVASALAPATP